MVFRFKDKSTEAKYPNNICISESVALTISNIAIIFTTLILTESFNTAAKLNEDVT